MLFKTNRVCPDCLVEIVVYPAYLTVSKITQRSLPAWKRCQCKPKFQEITSAEFEVLVPGWRSLIELGDPNELLED